MRDSKQKDRRRSRPGSAPSGSVRHRRSRKALPALFGRAMFGRDGVDSQPLPVPSLPLARLMLHVNKEKPESCRALREPIRTSTILGRSSGIPPSPRGSLPRRPGRRRCSSNTAGRLEAPAAPWSRASFPRRQSRSDSTSPLSLWPSIATTLIPRCEHSGPCTCPGRVHCRSFSTRTRTASSCTAPRAAALCQSYLRIWSASQT